MVAAVPQVTRLLGAWDDDLRSAVMAVHVYTHTFADIGVDVYIEVDLGIDTEWDR